MSLEEGVITPKQAVHYGSNATTPILRNMNASERWIEFRCWVRPFALTEADGWR